MRLSAMPRPTLFQFHKGTIKTSNGETVVNGNVLFQFHKGTIKTRSLTIRKLRVTNFNSIKVRLKPDTA